ncbi:7825_t:CDS:2 [Diversispora eburnea]|uniref:7825_t:CDS:1 n=1 Tax=Diversispora eburnea TaxID=1213867 RepID=A0A9N8WMI6_9GLOM|nr:7825_t:CDS:2 [Diversispora eburnea]
MQFSIIARIIFFFVFVHVIQAYKTTLLGDFASICHIYVTDCNGEVLRDAGRKDCNQAKIFEWDEAPDIYCLHVYPITKPKDNRYIMVTKNDSCIDVCGDLIYGWKLTRIGMKPCNDPTSPQPCN